MADTSLDVFTKMQTGDPYRTFRKTHLGKVHVRILNPFDDKPIEEDLYGNPDDPSCKECYVDVWDEKGYVYFKRANTIHLESGALIEAERPEKPDIKKTYNNLSDKALEDLVEGKYFTLKAAVEGMTSEEALIRTLVMAEEAGRPEKTVTFIRERLALMQSGELDATNISN